MTYQVITLDEKTHNRTIFGTFCYPSNDAKRVVSFLQYLKGAKCYDKFLLHEIETDRAILLSAAFDSIVNALAK